MADKEKRFRKILSKFSLKGKLKSVATLDEAHIVIVEDRNDKSNSKYIGERGLHKNGRKRLHIS